MCKIRNTRGKHYTCNERKVDCLSLVSMTLKPHSVHFSPEHRDTQALTPCHC
jgi:hypothetical protein